MLAFVAFVVLFAGIRIASASPLDVGKAILAYVPEGEIELAYDLYWVHAEPVVVDKNAIWSAEAGVTFDLYKGFYAGFKGTLFGLRPWEKNPRNGLDAIIQRDYTVTSYDWAKAMTVGYDFGPCQALIEHTTYATRTVPQGRYWTRSRIQCTKGF